ncbi:MAG: acetylornithine/succinylornithine family transaminase, partial [Eubacteriales bacterium]|nr:acetylornithine/succinylornithine family transaminase [Eubacteriales bacterium]
MDFLTIKELDKNNAIQNYGRYDVAFTYGEGSYLYDSEGKEYLDFSSGIGVASVGYSDPHWVKSVCDQVSRLAHVSNLYYTEPYVRLAERLTALSGMKAVFFGNSGAEANEGAIKIARKYSYDKYGKGRGTIITLFQSFHGRTMTTLTATGQPSLHQHFFPFPKGHKYIMANDQSALEEAMTEDVCAVMVEGIQGEGGVIPLEDVYVHKLAKLAEEKDILLIFDEVQTGNGRTGSMYCYQGYEVKPNIVTTAKGLGGGLPIGAILTDEKCSCVLTPGTHGSTFGANPICCSAANGVLDILTRPGFLDEVKKKGDRMKNVIRSWELPAIKEVRGKGLMLGVQLEGLSPKEAAADLLKKGLVVLTAGQ